MKEEPKISIGTLVRMLPRTDVKEDVVRNHGHLWIVVDLDPSKRFRVYVLKSVATGHIEHFNDTGLIAFNEEHNP